MPSISRENLTELQQLWRRWWKMWNLEYGFYWESIISPNIFKLKREETMSQVVRRQECMHFTASRSTLQKLFPLIFLYVVVVWHSALLLCVFSVLQSVTPQGNLELTVMGVFTPQKLVSTANQGFLAQRATCWIFIGSLLLLFPNSKTLGKSFYILVPQCPWL